MIVRFWGVRGSIPTPLTPEQVQSKIMAVIQRAKPSDLENAETRAKFLASLPSWLYGTAGGNTSCVEIRAGNAEFVLDAGSGIRGLGKSQTLPADNHYNLFFSHFHWDHIQGLPFFDAAFNPNSTFDVYTCFKDARKYLEDQMENPYFPVPFGSFTKNFTFHTLVPGETYDIEGVEVRACPMSHPGGSYSYSFKYKGKKVVYATDVELKISDYVVTPESRAVFEGADCIILDAQYTAEEALRKVNWGHSSFCYAIDFAAFWKIEKLYMFHHEPTYDDKKLNSILQAAQWYADYINRAKVEIHLAKESLEIEL